MRSSGLVSLVAAAVVSLLVPVAAWAVEGEHSDNMSHIKTLGYEARNGTVPNFGTDIEFARIAGRQYALAGSYRNGLQIVDISKPEKAEIVAVYDCGITQGDVQIFRQKSKPGRTFATYTSDTFGDGTSTCYREAEALGFDVLKPNGEGKNGTFIVELTQPRKPKTVSFVEVEKGSHNQTVHPSGRYLYNSNSELITSFLPAIEVFDVSDFSAPILVAELDLPTRPGLGTESHDITFNADGDRAYSAALSQGVIIDTSDPADPAIVSSWIDPAINVWHQSDPVTFTDDDGNERDFVLVEDEFAGALPAPACPSGGFHVYDITGENERSPVKVGYWNIDDVGVTDDPLNTCTAHVFRIYPEEQLMTVAFYNGGVRVVDISGLAGISLGETSYAGEGMKEIGFFRIEGADTWAAKTPGIDRRTGDFYLYGNDIARGLDIYKFHGDGAPSKRPGRWMSAEQSEAQLAVAQPQQLEVGQDALVCLLPE
jgi:hypothetical protein